MASPTNAFTRFSAIGVREDLSNTIYNIAPTETPFVSNIGKKGVKNTFFEWQTDTLAAASTTNATIEGDDTTAQSVTATNRLGNYTQIFKKSFTLTGTMKSLDLAGRKSEQALQMAKKGKELKRDLEATLTSQSLAVVGGVTTARQTAAFDSWLASNTDNGASGTNYTYTTTPTAARTGGTARAFTETILKNIIKLQWTSGGQTKILMTGPVNKQRASGFAGIASMRKEVGDNMPGTIIGAADVYVSDFGNVSVVPSRFQPESVAYLVDPEYVSVGTLRPFFAEELAKTGDADKFHMIIEAGLQVSNEAAHGVARDLTTT